jgi:hypothetical protein
MDQKTRVKDAQDGGETTMFRPRWNDGRRVIALRWKFEDWVSTDWLVMVRWICWDVGIITLQSCLLEDHGIY